MIDVIYKYPLPPVQGRFELMLPIGAKVLSVGAQKGSPFMWVLQSNDTEKMKVPYPFACVWTGQAMHEECTSTEFLGSVICADGALVCHYFAL